MEKLDLKYATILIVLAALISGTNNFLTKIGVTAVGDPVLFTTLKNGIVALFLLSILLALKKWREFLSLTPDQIAKLILIGVIGGAIPFALFFTGLSKTTALNAALIHKTLFFWVFCMAVPLLKEKITKSQIIGILAIFAANFIVGGFTGFKYNLGELMILAATILWAMESIIAKIVLKNLSSLIVTSARMTIGTGVLAVVVMLQNNARAAPLLTQEQWLWTWLTSILLLGYVLTWYGALKRAPATYVATLLVPATLVTNILTAIFVTHTVSPSQIFSSILLMAGIMAIVFSAKKALKPIAKEALYQFKTSS